jgi:hypothetical protein
VTRNEFDRLVEQATQKLRAYDAEPPGALFDHLVKIGFIDREGRVTTLLGGDAAMEPDAVPPVPAWSAAR